MTVDVKRLSILDSLLTLTALFTSITAQKDIGPLDSFSELNYTKWLKLVDDSILKIPPKQRIASLQIPLDLQVNAPSGNEQCVSTIDPYCFTEPVETTFGRSCAFKAPLLNCSGVICGNPSKPVELKNFASTFRFVATDINAGERELVTSSACGLQITVNSLNFRTPQESCTLSPRQPTIKINISELDKGATVMFTVKEPSSNAFLNITASSQSRSEIVYMEINSTHSYTVGSAIERSYEPLLLGKFALLLKSKGWAVFSEGELARTVSIISNDTVDEIKVGFGSDDFTGEVTNIQMYTTVIDSNQVYSLYSGEPLAKYQILPECECPPEYFDTFGLVSNSFEADTCTDGLDNVVLTDLKRYTNYAGKWEIFGKRGWLSEFADEVKIFIKFPQPMLTYAIAGRFLADFQYKLPSAIEVEIVGPDSDTRAQVFISTNCYGDYGLPVTPFSFEMALPKLPLRKKRSVDQPLPPKCYNLEDYLFLSRSIYSTLPSIMTIPILAVGEENYRLSDSLVGDVRVRMIGHLWMYGAHEDWYQLSYFTLYTRPHCGGHNFTIVGEPNNMREYYSFHKPGAKAYTCHCPEGITGDMCESCEEIAGVYRYFKSPHACANCDCSDLSRDANKRCEIDTGQCDCGPNVNQELAGRQCHWYVEDVFPLSGPSSGGTNITARVGYLNQHGIELAVILDGAAINYTILENYEEITFTIPKAHSENSTVNLIFKAMTTLDIGMHIKLFLFDYLPNPIIQNITPRATILKGGISQTVKGHHFDTVSSHQMLVYLKEFNGTKTTITTDCTLLSEGEMLCPTPDLTLQVEQLLNKTSAEIDEYQLNEYNISFALGLIFGQFEFYEELENNTDSYLRSLAQLYVYEDPYIYTFMDEYSQSYQEVNSDELVILFGENLDKGAAQKDYIIEVGQSYCNLTGFSTHQLVCRLPSKEPAVLEGNTIQVKKKDIPHVKVTVGNVKTNVGYLYYLNRIWYDNDPFRQSMIGLITTGVLAGITVTIFCVVKTCHQKKKLAALTTKTDDSSALDTERSGNESVRHWFLKRKLDENVQTDLDRCKIPNEKLSIGKQIGKGNFGIVYKGQLVTPSGNLKTVAVKTLKDDQELSFKDFESFLIEGTMMIDFKHKNVLSVIGVICEEGERPMVVLPYMENGDLCSLIKCEDLELMLFDILHFGLQIANGMSYLAKERFVHRDLATRNCMVDGSFIVKISDFGMSRDIYEKDYYSMEAMNKPVPLKWMAVESLKEGRYSSKSDVWSYGVTIWELLTRGSSPYPGVSNYHIKEYVTSGKRLDKPSNCPPEIFKEISKCWEEEPERRPTFDDLSDYLTKVLRGEIIPSAGSGQMENYYSDRSVTKNIPEDYLDMADVGEPEEYLQPIKTQAPLNQVSFV